MTDHYREEVAKMLDEMGVTVVYADDPVDGSRIEVVHLSDLVRIGHVFEQAEAKPKQNDATDFANAPTADKRGYDSDMAVMLSQLVEDEPMWSCVVIAKELHAAGFRRTVQDEPTIADNFLATAQALGLSPGERRAGMDQLAEAGARMDQAQGEPTDAAENNEREEKQ